MKNITEQQAKTIISEVSKLDTIDTLVKYDFKDNDSINLYYDELYNSSFDILIDYFKENNLRFRFSANRNNVKITLFRPI